MDTKLKTDANQQITRFQASIEEIRKELEKNSEIEVFDQQEALNREERLERHIDTVVTVGLEIEDENLDQQNQALRIETLNNREIITTLQDHFKELYRQNDELVLKRDALKAKAKSRV